MTRARDGKRSIVLASLLVLSVVAGTAVFAGAATASANNLRVISDQPVAGTDAITVRTTVTRPGASVAFKIRDAEGAVSQPTTVVDGGPADQSSTEGVVVTTLDLGAMFETTPASGVALIAADQGGDAFSFRHQTYDTKRQFAIDASAPTVAISGASSTQWTDAVHVEAGHQVKIAYTIVDVPQKIRSATMTIIGPDGTVERTFENLQAGEDRAVQFAVPSDWQTGEYDVVLTATDEAGHRSSTTLQDGLVVEYPAPSISANTLTVRSDGAVSGTGTLTVMVGTPYAGAQTTFKVRGTLGMVSDPVVVTDGGPADQSPAPTVIVTSLDLGEMFEITPATGSALVAADHGDRFSFRHQTYTVKRQFTIDAAAPTVQVTAGSTDEPEPVTAQPSGQVQIRYTITDNPQKVESASMKIVGPDGTVLKTVTHIQAGTDQNAQFVVPSDWQPGEYDIVLTATDSAGHQSTDTYGNGLIVTTG